MRRGRGRPPGGVSWGTARTPFMALWNRSQASGHSTYSVADALTLHRHRFGPSLVRGLDLKKKFQPQLAHSLPEVRAVSIGRIAQHGCRANPVGVSLLDQRQRQLRLGAKHDLGRHSGRGSPLGVFAPTPRQVQLRRDGGGHPAFADHQFDEVLTKLGVSGGLTLTVRVECRPEGGLSPQKIEEIKSALRELGLDDGLD